MFRKYKYIKSMIVALGVCCIGVGDAKSSETTNSEDDLFDCYTMNQICKNLKKCDDLIYTIPLTYTEERKKIVHDQIDFCNHIYRNAEGLVEGQLAWDGRCTLICDKIRQHNGCKGHCGPMPDFPKP